VFRCSEQSLEVEIENQAMMTDCYAIGHETKK